jgi:hypothetical protein
MATTDLSDLMVTVGDDTYYEDNFRNAMEDRLLGLIADGTNKTITTDGATALANKYDFYSLLTDLSIPMQYHFAILRMNGYRSPSDYLGDLTSIVVPAYMRVDTINTLQQTSTTITS